MLEQQSGVPGERGVVAPYRPAVPHQGKTGDPVLRKLFRIPVEPKVRPGVLSRLGVCGQRNLGDPITIVAVEERVFAVA